MSDKTAIEWTDATWNPIVGCSLVSPGCTNCYAMRYAARIEKMQNSAHDATYARQYSPYAGLTQPSKAGPVWNGAVARASDDALTHPLRWNRPLRISVNSMGDLFHELVPDAWIDRVFAVMALAPQHVFQVLTKRSKRMREYLTARNGMGNAHICRAINEIPAAMGTRHGALAMPLPNVWLGVSVEDQPRADERIPDLLATPAAVRFVSAEPLLGAIDFDRIDVAAWLDTLHPGQKRKRSDNDPDMRWPLLRPFDHWPSGYCSPGLDWIIVGGESGPGARPMHPDWARSIRDQCAEAGVAFFFQQWGEWVFDPRVGRKEMRGDDQPHPIDELWSMIRVGKRRAGRLLDGVEHNAMPEPRP